MEMLAYLLPFFMFIVMLACVGWSYPDGLWSNAIRLVNTITAALLAMNFFEPVARWAEKNVSASYTYLWDFLALWGLFFVITLVLRGLTDTVSRVKVKFLKLADRIGSGVLSVWIGWVMVCFTMASLHTVPLSENFLFGGFKPKERMIAGLAPDRLWLGFVQQVSRGGFCRTASDDEVRSRAYGNESDPDAKLCVFDRNANFIPKYSNRRRLLEAHVKSLNSLLGPPW
jgi:uncharacterized membrane protein required for colicin V production